MGILYIGRMQCRMINRRSICKFLIVIQRYIDRNMNWRMMVVMRNKWFRRNRRNMMTNKSIWNMGID